MVICLVESYSYDSTDGPNGHRTAWTLGATDYAATYDGQDRLLTYGPVGGATTTLGYDAHGNVTTRTTSSLTTTYHWDPRGPLVRVERPSADDITYVLDPAGRRVGRKVGATLERAWLYQGLHPVAELDGDGSTVRRVFVYATRGHSPDLALHYDGSAWVTYRVLSDHLGSVRAVVRASDGVVVQRMDYDAFGRVTSDWSASGWTPLPFGFAGGLYDRDTGLVRFGAREYDPAVGRWMSRDPIGFAGGDGNLYGYCAGDPVGFIDPNGLTTIVYNISTATLTIFPEHGPFYQIAEVYSGRSSVSLSLPSSLVNLPGLCGGILGACGLNNPSAVASRERGPIPPGLYYLRSSAVVNPDRWGDLQNFVLGHNRGDWGVRLVPASGTQTYGRGGFMMHGSIRNQSAGCIALGGGPYGDARTDRVLADIMNDADGVVPVVVVAR